MRVPKTSGDIQVGETEMAQQTWYQEAMLLQVSQSIPVGRAWSNMPRLNWRFDFRNIRPCFHWLKNMFPSRALLHYVPRGCTKCLSGNWTAFRSATAKLSTSSPNRPKLPVVGCADLDA